MKEKIKVLLIGSQLADALLQPGQHVAVIDDFSTGALKNISHVCSFPNCQLGAFQGAD